MTRTPPVWATRIHRLVADPERVEAQLGDLAEELSASGRRSTRGARDAGTGGR